MKSAQPWGRLPSDKAAVEHILHDRHALLPPTDGRSMLAHGLGRSYGDVALNGGDTLLRTRGLDRFIRFDPDAGVLRAEAGVCLDEILTLVVPLGWFLPVTPGTRFVTMGGAVANDVHGKNHHSVGSFGHHVRALELLRSDGTRLECRPEGPHAAWLRATIGGLGLTGLIVWVEIALVRVGEPALDLVNRRFEHLDAYWDIDAELSQSNEFTVAWVDCLNRGRGIYSAANFVANASASAYRPKRRSVPINLPFSLVNGPSVRLFNFTYFHRPIAASAREHAFPFFYPLDGVSNWNRIYGRNGFFQYQCVIPPDAMRDGSKALLKCVERYRTGSFLAVFKTFGDHTPAGMLSFPRAGATLAIDFPNANQRQAKLFVEMDAIVSAAGGALYPAKDARMSRAMFESSFPQVQAFSAFVDPSFSSSFWRRVTQ